MSTAQDQENINKGGASDGVPESFLSLHSSPSTLTLFKSRRQEFFPTSTAIDKTAHIIKVSIRGKTNEFLLPYLTKVHTKWRMTKPSGGIWSDNDTDKPKDMAMFVNGLASAAWKNVSVAINNKTITSQDNLYMYKADIENRLFLDAAEKKHDLKSAGFYPGSGKFVVDRKEAMWGDKATDPNTNARHQACRRGKLIHVRDRIHSELFDQPKPILPNTTIDLTFERNADRFIVKTFEDPVNHVAVLEDLYVEAHFAELDSETYLDILEITSGGDLIKYQLRRVVMTALQRSRNITDLSEHALWTKGNILPRRIIFGMVDQASFQGAHDKDPFEFEKFKLARTELYIGGQIRPWATLDNDISRLDALKATCAPALPAGANNGLDVDNFVETSYFTGYDLMPAEDIPPLAAFSPPLTDPIQLKIMLESAPTTHEITIIIYSEYEAEMHMDAHGNVMLHENALYMGG